MVNINFWASLILFLCGAVSALILWFGLKIWIGQGIKGIIAASLIGWFGAWLSATIESWGPKIEKVALIPAILGAFSLILIVNVLFPPAKD